MLKKFDLFFSIDFTDSGINSRSLLCFELIFLWYVIWLQFHYFTCDYPDILKFIWTNFFFSTSWTENFYNRLIIHEIEGLSLNSVLYFISHRAFSQIIPYTFDNFSFIIWLNSWIGNVSNLLFSKFLQLFRVLYNFIEKF